jgi:hypothetical protein
LVEGLTDDPADTALSALMSAVDNERTKLTKHTASALNDYLTKLDADGSNYKLNHVNAWDALKSEININELPSLDVDPTSDAYVDLVNDEISGGDHATLLQNTRKMRRLRNNLDNKIKVLNQLGDSHVTEKQLQLDSTIYISLAWTVVASSLVYYTLTQ